MFKKVQPKTYFPVIWFESKFELIDSLAFKMWLLSHLKDMMSIGGLLSVKISCLYLNEANKSCNGGKRSVRQNIFLPKLAKILKKV